eukprot:1760748-Rhodomonas_salina.1
MDETVGTTAVEERLQYEWLRTAGCMPLRIGRHGRSGMQLRVGRYKCRYKCIRMELRVGR